MAVFSNNSSKYQKLVFFLEVTASSNYTSSLLSFTFNVLQNCAMGDTLVVPGITLTE